MVQANTFDSTLAGNHKARVTVETMQDRLLSGWEWLRKLMSSRIQSVHADRAPDAQPLSGYYAGAHDRVSAAEPVVSLRNIEHGAHGPRR
jgi:hypothetical protein